MLVITSKIMSRKIFGYEICLVGTKKNSTGEGETTPKT